MPGEWPINRVGDLADSISETHDFGKQRLIFLNTSDVLLGKILHNSYSAVKDWPGQAKKSIRNGDILFSEIRPANGRWAFVETEAEDYVVSTKLMVIRAKDSRILPRFLYHYLTSRTVTGWLQHLAESRSGTFPQITFDQISALELPLPPGPHQTAIAAFFDSIDDKIELNHRMNRTLERIARAIFKSWFVDFDPVQAKVAGQNPPDLSPAIADLFPNKFYHTAIGPIPDGWEVGRLDDVLTLQRGFDLPAVQRVHGKYPVMAASGPNGWHDKFMVRGPGVTTGRSGVLGKVFFIQEDFWPLNTSLWVKEFKRVSPAYAFHMLRGLDFKMFNSGSAVPTLNRNHVHNLPVVVPPKRIVDIFDSLATPLIQQQKANSDQSRTLTTLRDTLVPKLMSGELRVPGALDQK